MSVNWLGETRREELPLAERLRSGCTFSWSGFGDDLGELDGGNTAGMM